MQAGSSELNPPALPNDEAYCTSGSSPGKQPSISPPAPTRDGVPKDLPVGVRAVAALGPSWHPDHHPELAGRFRVPYEVAGPADAPVVVVLGGISANRHVCANTVDPTPGWWRNLVGSGLAIDPADHRVVGIDFLGLPGTVEPSARALCLKPEDQADAIVAVLDDLGVSEATIIGSSYGGMVALAAAVEHPKRVRSLVVLASAHRPHPHASGVRAIQRQILDLATDVDPGTSTLAVARALALTTYTTSARMDARFQYGGVVETDGSGTPAVRSPVEDFLEDRSRRWAKRFDPEAFRSLSWSIDLCDVDPTRITQPVTVIGWEEDALVPAWLIDELTENLPSSCRRYTLSSSWGHDAFLEGSSAQAEALSTALAEGGRS